MCVIHCMNLKDWKTIHLQKMDMIYENRLLTLEKLWDDGPI